MDNLFQSVAEALDSTNEAIDVQIQDHGKRIVRLERKLV